MLEAPTPDLDEVIENEDGSATVFLPEEEDEDSNFSTNLAETLDDFTLNTLSSRFEDHIEADQKARQQRDKQYEEGIRRTGLGDDAPGGAQFSGASRAVHPILAEGCVDFAARTIKELFPANGPVKIKITGEGNEKRLEKAKRKRDYLNWMLTEHIKEYRDEKEILLTQLPLGGSQYEKYWYDPSKGRIRMEFVPVDKVLLPYSAVSFYTTPRLTHLQDITRDEFDARVESGFYRQIDNLTNEQQAPEETAAETANDKIEGLSSGEAYDDDGLRRIYEISCWLKLDGDEELSPYIVHMDGPTSKIAAIYRNWMEDDESRQPLDWWVEDKFIPWRGPYGIGLPHLIGGLASALTGALRALLDSAHINNSPGAVKLKGGRASGANTAIAQTEIKEIDAPAGIDDIRKVMMPLPFNPPSTVLFQLLDWISAQAKGVVATAEEKIADAGNNMPVGTALALIEQGSQVFSSIHSRLHHAQQRGLKIICRLIRQYPDEESLQRFGLTAEDFDSLDGIDPVSDPNIFSESQRFAQFQAALQLAGQLAQGGVPVKLDVLGRRGFELLRMDGIDEFMPKPPEPITADPITENVAASSGTPLKPSPQQDHLAHAWTHVGYVLNPIHQMNPAPQPYLMAILAHVAEHLNMHYAMSAKAGIESALAVAQASGDQPSMDQIAMNAARTAQQMQGKLLQDFVKPYQQAMQFAQSKMPQPPMDPAIKATFDAAIAQVEARKKADADRLAFEREKVGQQTAFEQFQAQNEARLAQMKMAGEMQLAQQAEENRRMIAMIQEQGKASAEEIRQQVEMMKNDADNQQHQLTELLKNRDDNQTAYLIEQLKLQLAPAQETTPRQDDGMLKEMQRMLGEIEKAKTGDALTATVEALRQMMAGNQAHQERMMNAASSLLSSDN